jgi:glycosyltransferase involved in cell wall biosynthesis
MPKVSVIIPTYNRADFLPRAIESVLEQTYADFELVIVDDGSTDETADVVARYADPRIRYHWQENQERSAARNEGIALSQGAYVTFLDSDDWYLPCKLACQAAVLDADPEVGMVASGWSKVDSSGRTIKEYRPWLQCPAPVALDWLLCGLTVVGANMVRREHLDRVGGFDSELLRTEDTYLWFHLVWSGCDTGWAEEMVMMQRVHPENSAGDGRRMRDWTLKMLSKVYALPGVEAALGPVKDQVLATGYLNGSLRLYAAGCVDEAKEDLSRAVQLDPSLLDRGGEKLLQAIWSHANDPYTVNPEGFVYVVLDHLPTEVTRLAWRRRFAVSGIWIDRAFHAYQQGYVAEARRAVARAVCHHLGWIRNRGVVSIWLRSVLGRSTAPRIGRRRWDSRL